jgi:hypothetical protein
MACERAKLVKAALKQLQIAFLEALNRFSGRLTTNVELAEAKLR